MKMGYYVHCVALIALVAILAGPFPSPVIGQNQTPPRNATGHVLCKSCVCNENDPNNCQNVTAPIQGVKVWVKCEDKDHNMTPTNASTTSNECGQFSLLWKDVNADNNYCPTLNFSSTYCVAKFDDTERPPQCNVAIFDGAEFTLMDIDSQTYSSPALLLGNGDSKCAKPPA